MKERIHRINALVVWCSGEDDEEDRMYCLPNPLIRGLQRAAEVLSKLRREIPFRVHAKPWILHT